MKINIVLSVFPICIFLVGCRSSESTQNSQSPHTDTLSVVVENHNVPMPRRVNSPTTIKQNVSYVTAVVDSIHLLGEYDYRLFATIRTVTSKDGMESFVEPHQQLELRPALQTVDDQGADANDERNKKILQLRTTQRGDSFIGSISLTIPGGWILTHVENIVFTH